MKVLGKRANMCLFVYPVVFLVCTAISIYFGQMLHDYGVALENNDIESVERLGELIEKYTVNRSYGRGWGRLMLNPFGFSLYGVLIGVYSIYAFNKRIVQPRDLIECDDRGFYLNLPFNKTWYVHYEEILFIDVRKDEDRLWVIRRSYHHSRSTLSGLPRDPDAYVNVKNSTFGLLKTGTIVVGLIDRDIKVHGVKNAFEVAKQMQVICNDGKRRRNEWLDEKKREQELKETERREQELRERTKT